MKDYIVFMHNDLDECAESNSAEAWAKYLAALRESGQFAGGSAIGHGECVVLRGQPRPITAHLTGYIRIQATSLEEAKRLMRGNPVLASGGTVEIRELPPD